MALSPYTTPVQAQTLVARQVLLCLAGWGGVVFFLSRVSTFLPIASSSGRAGQDWVDFGLAEPHTVLFHEPGSSTVWVGGRGKVYIFDFPEGKNASKRTVSLDPSA